MKLSVKHMWNMLAYALNVDEGWVLVPNRSKHGKRMRMFKRMKRLKSRMERRLGK